MKIAANFFVILVLWVFARIVGDSYSCTKNIKQSGHGEQWYKLNAIAVLNTFEAPTTSHCDR